MPSKTVVSDDGPSSHHSQEEGWALHSSCMKWHLLHGCAELTPTYSSIPTTTTFYHVQSSPALDRDGELTSKETLLSWHIRSSALYTPIMTLSAARTTTNCRNTVGWKALIRSTIRFATSTSA